MIFSLTSLFQFNQSTPIKLYNDYFSSITTTHIDYIQFRYKTVKNNWIKCGNQSINWCGRIRPLIMQQNENVIMRRRNLCRRKKFTNIQNNTLSSHKMTRRQQNNEILETKKKKANKEGEKQKAKQNMQRLWMTEYF